MMTRRLVQLFWGLALYGFAIALMIRADLGLNPWDVFHQGLSERFGWSIGTSIVAVGAAALLLWIPLRQKPGFGTLANLVLIGVAADASLAVIPEVEALGLRYAFLFLALWFSGVAGGAYIGAGLGPGPRDGLMTGLVGITGWRLDRVRTGLEVAVLAAGALLGGTFGLGTIAFAALIGPLVHYYLPIFTIDEEAAPGESGQRLQDCAP
jgi:uncharacterized membrane protein YczE